jgi:enolase
VEDVLNKNINTSPRDMDMHMVKTLDGTSNEWGFNKSKLGANAILPVSMNLFQLQASLADKPLYS